MRQGKYSSETPVRGDGVLKYSSPQPAPSRKVLAVQFESDVMIPGLAVGSVQTARPPAQNGDGTYRDSGLSIMRAGNSVYLRFSIKDASGKFIQRFEEVPLSKCIHVTLEPIE